MSVRSIVRRARASTHVRDVDDEPTREARLEELQRVTDELQFGPPVRLRATRSTDTNGALLAMNVVLFSVLLLAGIAYTTSRYRAQPRKFRSALL